MIAAGVDLTLVSPTGLDTAPRPWTTAAWHSLRSGRPLTIERHARPALAARIADLLRHTAPFDIVHIEQLQALASAAPAVRTRAACVLRMQNVESEIWRMAAGHKRGVARLVWQREAARVRRFEAAAIGAADLTIALSTTDAASLSALTPAARVITIAPPAARARSAMDGSRLAGQPAFTWIGSPGWPPNDDALIWLTGEIWPALTARVPGARLHVFALHAPGAHLAPSITWHRAPADSSAAFADGAILMLPLRSAAGVRMRLLEAWTRGVPALASPDAVEGLETADGRDVLIASDTQGFAEAGARLAADAELRARLVEGGRATVARRHDPSAIAAQTIAAYHEAIARRRAR